MLRFGFVLLACIALACNNKKNETKETREKEQEFSYAGLSELFRPTSLPYQLTDTGLLKRKDTALIRFPEFDRFIADSVKNKIFSRGSKVKYYPLAEIKNPKAEAYFLVKAVSGDTKAALLISFAKDGSYAATLPFLVPDDDPGTSQTSSIDQGFTISKSSVRKKDGEVIGEGKDVYVYNGDTKQFSLIMTDLLDEQDAALINPIDTFPRTRKFAGDYVQGKRNIVSIRNGRTPNQALAFVHLEKNDGKCIGELKGEILFTSPSTAIYRQGGDPCVLQFSFTSSSVTLKEEQGCGNHRGLDCEIEGRLLKKKEARTRSSAKKGTKK